MLILTNQGFRVVRCAALSLLLTIFQQTVADEPKPLSVLSGTLIDASSGQPVAGGTVILNVSTDGVTTSNDAGEFRFETLRSDRYVYTLFAQKDNLIRVVEVRAQPAAASSPPEFEPLRVEMIPGREARVVVTSHETNRPIPGAVVQMNTAQSIDQRTLKTGDDGTVAVNGLIPQRYIIGVHAEGYARTAQAVDLLKSRSETLHKVELSPEGIVRGVVIDHEERPIPDVSVGCYERALRSADVFVNGFYHSILTDADGKFTIRNLPLDEPLTFWANNAKFAGLQHEDVTLTADQRTLDVRLTLEVKPDGGSVAGVVQDENGNAVADAKVANYGTYFQSEQRLATTDAEGRFRLDDVFAGSRDVEVAFSKTGFSPQILDLIPG